MKYLSMLIPTLLLTACIKDNNEQISTNKQSIVSNKFSQNQRQITDKLIVQETIANTNSIQIKTLEKNNNSNEQIVQSSIATNNAIAIGDNSTAITYIEYNDQSNSNITQSSTATNNAIAIGKNSTAITTVKKNTH